MKNKNPIPDRIQGSVKPGFEPVREEFIRNFTQRGEVGAACTVYHKGEIDQFLLKNSLLARAWAQPEISSGTDHTLPENRGVEMPSKNGFGQVRSMAYAYSVFARGGKELGLRPETVSALSEPAVAPLQGSYDLVLHMQVACALGFYKPCPAVRFGINDRAYGSPGFGGSMGFADPELELGYAYALNLLILGQGQDPRETALREAL